MASERCECCGEGKDPVAETETAWQCNDCEQWNEGNPKVSDEMLTAMQAWLKKRDMTPEQAFGSSEFIREAYRLFEEQTNG